MEQTVQGDATAEELAALVAVLTAQAATATVPPERPAAPGWADRSALLRLPARARPGAWRASGLPR
ncbi:MAG TPA: acyl-CoA carboxylase subunit epsilon [Mycobacteriales bacterium]|nr:acyl-CoA carboxylase subunit epsilon [Mycobacteriales bacterium]